MEYTAEEIIDMFDTRPELTLRRLAEITGWAVRELKSLLMEERR